MRVMLDINTIKLVIWDLDDTFHYCNLFWLVSCKKCSESVTFGLKCVE